MDVEEFLNLDKDRKKAWEYAEHLESSEGRADFEIICKDGCSTVKVETNNPRKLIFRLSTTIIETVSKTLTKCKDKETRADLQRMITALGQTLISMGIKSADCFDEEEDE